MHRVHLVFVAMALGARADVTPMAPSVTSPTSAATDPAPLLVVLHGNGETATARAARWQDAAARHGWRILALDCPRDLGCDPEGKWYAWNGSAQWIFDRVAGTAEAQDTPIGRLPAPGALDLAGLKVHEASLAELLRVDVDAWQAELPAIRGHYEKFADRLPMALGQELAELEQRLAKGAVPAGR